MTDEQYAKQWLRYRRWNRLAIGLFLGFIPFVIFIVSASDYFSTAGKLVPMVAAGWLVAMGYSISRIFFFRCPQCGHIFALASWLYLTNGQKCAHCGLKRYENSGIESASKIH
ncbi:hypothetical protein [Rhodanobacter sp. MP1X3]|uniref:hypothetical protein n=1 Tax=Rhodanobacter sp. MP1X3 TaxID=2723086 RepID=UPI00161ADD71|nr:hypothetical protein [Rhodanobacter sp. MP1X3]MBB6242354.1 putative RNA-binding Zn-ribbon protein involved in translation (DUF1610 family) [Rhodanobacter sp. MP1X3]